MFLFDMTQHLFFTVITGSIITLAVIGVLLFLGIIYACVMEWADDNEKEEYYNPVLSFIFNFTACYRIYNITVVESGKMVYYKYGLTSNQKYERRSFKDLTPQEKEEAGGVCPYGASLFMVGLFTLCIPCAILLMLWIYPVTLTGLTLLALAHLLRFCKRLAKKFKKHTTDPEAHNEKS